MDSFIISELKASARLLQQIASSDIKPISRLSWLLADRLGQGNKLLVFGNGGSAADAQHLAAELAWRYRSERPGLPAISLTTDTSLLTAVGNDSSFERVFARQVEVLAQPGDVVIGLSTSGRSQNVLAALRTARQRGAHTAAMVGANLDAIAPLADIVISVPSTDTPRIQEAHGVIIHILCDLIEQQLFPGTPKPS